MARGRGWHAGVGGSLSTELAVWGPGYCFCTHSGSYKEDLPCELNVPQVLPLALVWLHLLHPSSSERRRKLICASKNRIRGECLRH